MAAVELRDRVAGGTGLTLASSLVFDHPTVQALARHLAGELGPDGGDPVATVLSQLDQLETAVAELDGGDAVREFVEPRLQALIARLAGRTRGPEEGGGRPPPCRECRGPLHLRGPGIRPMTQHPLHGRARA